MTRMTFDEEVRVATLRHRLQGGRGTPYHQIFREELIKDCIRKAMPWPVPGSFFTVCPINDTAKVLGIDHHADPSYDILRVYHCITYFRIPRPIRKRMPAMIRELLKAGAQ